MKKFVKLFSMASESQPKAAKKQPKEEKKAAKQPKKTTAKDKKKGVVEAAPPKKRGRPSNAELAIRAREKREAETALRKELIERQKAAASGSIPTAAPVEYDENDEKIVPEYRTDFTSKVKDPNWIPPWPIFLPGQRVQAEFCGITYKGTVWHDNVESQMIRVAWDDGSSQYAAKMNLKVIVKKTFKKLFSANQLKNMEE
jgi:hypothetical protein